jgi:uncharacterized protein YjbI with pentapeptide repeats
MDGIPRKPPREFRIGRSNGREIFSGLNLRGIRMDRAVLRGADFTGANLQSANLRNFV